MAIVTVADLFECETPKAGTVLNDDPELSNVSLQS